MPGSGASPLVSLLRRGVSAAPVRVAPALLAALALPAPVLAQLTPVAQSRSASFSWSDDEGTYFCLPPPTGCTPEDVTHTEDQDADQAPDFAAWSTSLGGIVTLDSSALGAHGFSASASHAASAIAVFQATGQSGEYYGHTSTTTSDAGLSYTFTVAEPTPIRLIGQVATRGAGLLGSMLARVRLTGPGGAALVDVELVDDDGCVDPECLDLGPEAVDFTGTLLAGSYTVDADLQGLAEPLVSITTGVTAANDYEGSFDLALTVPPPAPATGPLGLAALVTALVASARRRLA